MELELGLYYMRECKWSERKNVWEKKVSHWFWEKVFSHWTLKNVNKLF